MEKIDWDQKLGLRRLSAAVRTWGILAQREFDCKREGLLSQREVNSLPEGAQVEILWTGGNGPHVYTIRKFYDCVIASEANSLIDFVGLRPLTEVKLLSLPEV